MIAAVLISTLALALQTSTDVGPVSENSYILGPSDRIVVRCLNTDEVSPAPIRIDNDGRVTLPYVGRITLAGLTINDAEKRVADQLSKYIQHPEVELSVIESHSQPVSVFGAVKNPGAYQLEGRKTLIEVLAMAGGLRPDAGQTLKLTRRKEWGAFPSSTPDQRSVGDVNVAEISIDELVRGRSSFADLELHPHDVVSVSQAELIYVVGQVRKPGGFPMSGAADFSVLQALSLAEGLDRTAAPKRAVILRKRGSSGRTEVPVNLERILAGRAPDTRMEPEDVLFIPNNAAKSVGMKTLDTILQTTTGMAIYGRY